MERSQRNRNDDYAHRPAPPPPQHQQMSSSSAYLYSRRSGGNDRSSYSNMMPSVTESIPPQNEPRRTEKVFDYGHKPSMLHQFCYFLLLAGSQFPFLNDNGQEL